MQGTPDRSLVKELKFHTVQSGQKEKSQILLSVAFGASGVINVFLLPFQRPPGKFSHVP